MARTYKKRNENEILPPSIIRNINENIGDEISETIEEVYLKDYNSFKLYHGKLHPTKEEYEYLKKDSNWALYNDFSSYPKEYLEMIYDKAKELLHGYEEDNGEFYMDLLESDEFKDSTSNIASMILTDALKNIRKDKK
jgi:hypothetical protein